jgi:hypothetical protein
LQPGQAIQITSIMKDFFNFKCLLLLSLFSSSQASAEIFMAISPALIKIDAPTGSTRPVLIDYRLGYATPEHLFELAIMSSIKEDNLNQLTVDVPSVLSVFYRYSAYPKDRLKVHLILGASQIEVESTYPGVTDNQDSFDGVSFGLGFEEGFKTIPDLKVKFDWIQLYRGDQLNINLMSLGLRYDF